MLENCNKRDATSKQNTHLHPNDMGTMEDDDNPPTIKPGDIVSRDGSHLVGWPKFLKMGKGKNRKKRKEKCRNI